jgi:coiled-coil domain-containing protein 12
MTDENGSEDISELEQNAAERKKRLQQLRFRVHNTNKETKNGEENSDETAQLTFRSYQPIDLKMADIALNAGESVNLALTEESIKNQIEAAKNTQIKENLDLTTLAPRKADWDLRRGVQDKLNKLERKTQTAIAQLIRERLEADDDLLATAVGSAATADMSRYS